MRASNACFISFIAVDKLPTPARLVSCKRDATWSQSITVYQLIVSNHWRKLYNKKNICTIIFVYPYFISSTVLQLVLCCHSNETCALIANLPNSAQLETTPYHSPNLHPGPCNNVGMRRATETQMAVTNIHFASAIPHAKFNDSSRKGHFITLALWQNTPSESIIIINMNEYRYRIYTVYTMGLTSAVTAFVMAACKAGGSSPAVDCCCSVVKRDSRDNVLLYTLASIDCKYSSTLANSTNTLHLSLYAHTTKMGSTYTFQADMLQGILRFDFIQKSSAWQMWGSHTHRDLHRTATTPISPFQQTQNTRH